MENEHFKIKYSTSIEGMNEAEEFPEIICFYREAKLEGYNRFFSNLDESVKLLQNTCIDQTKKHQTAFKREYNKISHSFSKLSRAFDTDPSNCKCVIFL